MFLEIGFWMPGERPAFHQTDLLTWPNGRRGDVAGNPLGITPTIEPSSAERESDHLRGRVA